MSAAPILRFAGVTVGYGGPPVARNLSFELSAGEGGYFIGPNGCGKSTVLRGVLGLAAVAAGTITFNGSDVTRIPRSQFASRGLGYVPQGRGDFPSLTVDENIRFAANGGREADDRSAVVYELLPVLSPLRTRRVRWLSGGERTLVALARALVLRPRLKLLLLDEVSAGLSQVNLDLVRKLLTRLRTEGTAILLAEQNAAFAHSLGLPLILGEW